MAGVAPEHTGSGLGYAEQHVPREEDAVRPVSRTLLSIQIVYTESPVIGHDHVVKDEIACAWLHHAIAVDSRGVKRVIHENVVVASVIASRFRAGLHGIHAVGVHD